MEKVERVPNYTYEGNFYTVIAYSKSLKRKVRLVVFKSIEGKPFLYFSTDINMSTKDVVVYYRTRFQIEFCYRNGTQFAGLCDCQATDFPPAPFFEHSSVPCAYAA